MFHAAEVGNFPLLFHLQTNDVTFLFVKVEIHNDFTSLISQQWVQLPYLCAFVGKCKKFLSCLISYPTLVILGKDVFGFSVCLFLFVLFVIEMTASGQRHKMKLH